MGSVAVGVIWIIIAAFIVIGLLLLDTQKKGIGVALIAVGILIACTGTTIGHALVAAIAAAASAFQKNS